MALFKATYLINYLPPWSGNLGKRIVKTPKLFFTDTGLAAYLLGVNSDLIGSHNLPAGTLMKNFVLAELRKQATWSHTQPSFFHFRSQTGVEVDIILEDRSGRCLGIEVKTAATVRYDDFKGLRWLKGNLVGQSFLRGIVLYNGRAIVPFSDNLFAVPVSALW